MSQHDLDIANQTASAVRSDINNALQALGSTNSGASAPATTYANMLWYDTTSNILKIRAEANDAWISIGYFDQSADAFRILDDTQVTNTSGTQTGLLGDQSTATWEAGTGTTESLVSPAKVKSAIEALAPSQSTDAYAVGTYAHVGRYSTVVHNIGDTVAGSELFSWELYSSNDLRSGTTSATAPATAEGQAQTSFTGTWRWMSAGNQAGTRSRLGLAVRIS